MLPGLVTGTRDGFIELDDCDEDSAALPLPPLPNDARRPSARVPCWAALTPALDAPTTSPSSSTERPPLQTLAEWPTFAPRSRPGSAASSQSSSRGATPTLRPQPLPLSPVAATAAGSGFPPSLSSPALPSSALRPAALPPPAAAMRAQPRVFRHSPPLARLLALARRPQPPPFAELRAAMAALTLADIGPVAAKNRGMGGAPVPFLLEENLDRFRHCGFLPLLELPHATLACFVIPPGKALPLHDHPRMSVVARVLSGSMHSHSFRWEGPPPVGSTAPIAPATRTTADVGVDTAGVEVVYKPVLGQSRRAVHVGATVVTPREGALLQPDDANGGVLHKFSVAAGDTDAVVLCDYLTPPYGGARECRVFRCEGARPLAEMGPDEECALIATEWPADYFTSEYVLLGTADGDDNATGV